MLKSTCIDFVLVLKSIMHTLGTLSDQKIPFQALKICVVDPDDGRFLSTMEWQWFLSKNHCGQWFSMVLFTSGIFFNCHSLPCILALDD